MALVYVHGFKACECIRDSMSMIESRLRQEGLIKKDLSGLITQGCYSKGAVAASATTHNGGGVWDLKDWSPEHRRLDQALEDCGVTAWRRTREQGFTPHWHVIWRGCPHLDPAAARQVQDALKGLDGLMGRKLDQGIRSKAHTWMDAVKNLGATIVKDLFKDDTIVTTDEIEGDDMVFALVSPARFYVVNSGTKEVRSASSLPPDARTNLMIETKTGNDRQVDLTLHALQLLGYSVK